MDKLKDNFFFGVIIGALVPFISYLIVFNLLAFVVDENPLRESTMQVIAIFVNFPLFRSVLTKYKKDKLGRGMLLSTFALAFWYIYHHEMLSF